MLLYFMDTEMHARQQEGFTLIELMITLVVLVIALGIGIPSFVTWIKNNQLDTSTRMIVGVLQLARSEAVSRQRVITVRAGTVDNPGIWTNGAHIYTDNDVDGNSEYDAVNDTLIKDIDISMAGITVSSDDDNSFISFTSSGLLNEGNNPRSIAVCDDRGVAEGSLITLNTVGRTSIGTPTTCTP